MSECESDYLVRNLRLQEELSALKKELEEAKSNAHSFRLLAEGQKMRADKLTAERDLLAANLEEWKKARVGPLLILLRASPFTLAVIATIKKD